MFEGISNKKEESFTVRFGSAVFKTMRIEEIIPNEKIVWYVTDTLIHIPELNNKKEWLNTIVVWQLNTEETNIKIQVTHIGLNPDIDCYSICSAGWRQFWDSLKLYLEKGIGMPFKQDTAV
nr:SRPBCC domain-containing protein [Pedobacter psychrodurus]